MDQEMKQQMFGNAALGNGIDKAGMKALGKQLKIINKAETHRQKEQRKTDRLREKEQRKTDRLREKEQRKTSPDYAKAMEHRRRITEIIAASAVILFLSSPLWLTPIRTMRHLLVHNPQTCKDDVQLGPDLGTWCQTGMAPQPPAPKPEASPAPSPEPEKKPEPKDGKK